jgi:2-isopropylmalate synthase
MDVVRIFDTTLRDGEQSPGFSMNTAEKIRVAHQLAALNVDVIEAGFPISSRGDLEAVRQVAKEVRTVPIAALARARKDDVMAAVQALEPAATSRLHIFLATSDLHLKVKLNMTREQALESISSMIRLGRQHVGEVEFSAEDAGRTEIDFLCTVCRVAVEAGATVLNLPDTVGYAVPEEYAEMFRRVDASLLENFGANHGITLSAHCHDDLGLAVANSLAAIRAGVRQIECTINGIGERAGNASLEEVVVALAVRKESFEVTTGINLEQLFPASRLLSDITGAQVAPNKAIVGANAFAHEAGIHQDGIIKNPLTYEIMSPQMVGVPRRSMVLGKHSGRNALRLSLRDLGYEPTDVELGEVYKRVTALATKRNRCGRAMWSPLRTRFCAGVPRRPRKPLLRPSQILRWSAVFFFAILCTLRLCINAFAFGAFHRPATI